MAGPGSLVGRDQEREELERRLAAAGESDGGLVLVAGEAGVGKTRLVEECLAASGLRLLAAAASEGGSPPYAPIVGVLRDFLRATPDGLSELGPLASRLALLLPELGAAAEAGDRESLFESVRRALALVASRGPTAVFLDDLQWADEGTLDLLAGLARPLDDEPLLVVGAYRSDEISRSHPMRRLRATLRRGRRLTELALEPLDRDGTGVLVGELLGRSVAPSLGDAVFDRTEGLPFFVEELTTALDAAGFLSEATDGAKLADDTRAPPPATIRDAVLLRAESLSPEARAAAEAAAVAGPRFDANALSRLLGGKPLGELMEAGLVTGDATAGAAFRHALVRETLYDDVPRGRRRELHREVAAALEEAGAAPALVADHWLAAHEDARARTALLAAAHQSCALHAYRDAARLVGAALDLWPDDVAGRAAAVELLGRSSYLMGDQPAAAVALREACEMIGDADLPAVAGVQRLLASVYELQGDLERALAARTAAATALADAGDVEGAVSEHLTAALRLEGLGSQRVALERVEEALGQARAVGRTDLEARALGHHGELRAKLGELDEGLDEVRAALRLALDGGHVAAAAENYVELGATLAVQSEYPEARDAYETALDFCEARGRDAMAMVCVGCLVYILRETGEWKRASELGSALLAETPPKPVAPDGPSSERELYIYSVRSRIIGGGILGCIHAFRGETDRARPLLADCLAVCRTVHYYVLETESLWGLAYADALDGRHDSAAERCGALLDRWRATDDLHYAIPPLRWAGAYLAERGDGEGARACAAALGDLAAATGKVEALAALAAALGESALLDGDPSAATLQFGRALELHTRLEMPFERAQVQLRAGTALAAAGEHELAVERLVDSHRAARRLGARPLALEAAERLAAMGEKVERRLGRRAADDLLNAGLSRRELEVMRLVAVGRTNREIAQELFVSPRTIDMHVRNILNKLRCRSRTEAATKAGELGLLG